MIALLPVSRYRVTYDIGTGRPYAALTALTLRAIGTRVGTVEELSDTFHVHQRLIIESLITLIHAGWIALGGPDHDAYLLTAEGSAALKKSTLPSSLQIVRDLRAAILVERVFGLLASGNEVDYQTEPQLRKRGVWDHCVPIRAMFHSNNVDEGQVQHLLYRPEGHWLERVGPITLESKHTHWAPVTVDLERSEVHLPTSRWDGPLAELVLKEVLSSDAARDRSARERSWSARRGRKDSDERPGRGVDAWPACVEPEDIITTGISHRRHLRNALAQAEGAVLISSAFMTVAVLEDLEDDLRTALERNTDIDMLWGYDAEDGLALDRLKKIAYDARSASGSLRFNRMRSGTHSKILIWSTGGEARAVIGSFNWLSAQPSEDRPAMQGEELSIVLREPGAVAAVARTAAGIWLESGRERLATAPHYWRGLAAELEAISVGMASAEGFRDVIRLVRDREHEGRLLEKVMGDEPLVIASHRLGATAAPRLRGLTGVDGSREIEVRYGECADTTALETVQGLLVDAGGQLRHLPGLHAKMILTESAAVIGSYNFLAADPYGTAERSRELSVEVSGAGAALIWQAVR